MSLESFSVKDLRGIATQMQISGRTKLKLKRDLVRAIQEARDKEGLEMDTGTRRKKTKKASQAIDRVKGHETCKGSLGLLLKDSQVLPKSSASDSIQLLATIDNVPVFIKLMFSPRWMKEKYDGLLTERNVYEKVVRPLMNFSPHFVMPIGIYTCKKIQEVIKAGSKLEKAYKELTSDPDFKEIYNVKGPVHLMITERAYPGDTLYRFLDTRLSWLEVKQLLFQLAFTLHLMERVGFAHNDLHTDNLFVYDLGVPQEIFYQLETGEVFRLYSRYQIALFDWDLSVVYPEPGSEPKVPTIKNPHLTRLGKCWVGAADAFSPLLDWYRANWYTYTDIVIANEFKGNPWRSGYISWITKFISGDLFLFDALHSRDREGRDSSMGTACFNNWDLDTPMYSGEEYEFNTSNYAVVVEKGFPEAAAQIAEDLGLSDDAVVGECGNFRCPAVTRLTQLGYIDPLSTVLQEGFDDLRYDGAIPDTDDTVIAWIP